MQLVSFAAQPSDTEYAPEIMAGGNVQGRREKKNQYILLHNVFLIAFASHVHLWYLILSDVGMLTIN